VEEGMCVWHQRGWGAKVPHYTVAAAFMLTTS
jgi:hypothetical protein